MNNGETYTVTSIGSAAFRGYGLTSLTLPDTIRVLGAESFAENQLTEIVLPKDLVWFTGKPFKQNNISNVYLGSADLFTLVTTQDRWNEFGLDGANSDSGIINIYSPEVVGNYKDIPLNIEKTIGESITLTLEAEAEYKLVERFDDENDVMLGVDENAPTVPYNRVLDIQWYCDGVAIPGATSETYTGVVSTVGEHTYYAMVAGKSLGDINVKVNGQEDTSQVEGPKSTETKVNIVKTNDTISTNHWLTITIIIGLGFAIKYIYMSKRKSV